jgi:hypothetical protein
MAPAAREEHRQAFVTALADVDAIPYGPEPKGKSPLRLNPHVT